MNAQQNIIAASGFSLTKLLEDARLFERELSDEGELSALANIFDNLLRVPCGSWAHDVLTAAKADAECALENEFADRPFVKRVVL